MNPLTLIFSVAAPAFFVGYFYWAFRMIQGRRKGVMANGREVAWNSFNLCFRPSLLTDKGLRARKWFFVCWLGFAMSVLIPWIA
jgi:hypothetical protein